MVDEFDNETRDDESAAIEKEGEVLPFSIPEQPAGENLAEDAAEAAAAPDAPSTFFNIAQSPQSTNDDAAEEIVYGQAVLATTTTTTP